MSGDPTSSRALEVNWARALQLAAELEDDALARRLAEGR
jgi:hypothetical protein